MEAKPRQVIWILAKRLCIRRASATILSVQELSNNLHTQGAPVPDRYQLENVFVMRNALMDHMLLLDGALDRRTSEMIFRKEKTSLVHALPAPPTKALPVSLGSEGFAYRPL